MATLTAGPLPLMGVLLLALALRVWGLAWGLPSATHFFSYHPDESVVLEAAMSMNVFAGRLLPHFYHYGSLQLYLVNFLNSLAFLFGAADIVPKPLPLWHEQWARLYLIGRLLTVTMGVGTVWATYALGARLWGRRAGLLGALVLAVTPLHAQHSHWLTVDVPATFWVMLSLAWAARLATEDAKPTRAALWAGVFAGLAAATKYNMALTLLPVVAACLVARRPQGIGIAALGFAAAFLVACPGALLETPVFLHDVRFEAVHVQNADDPTFRGTGNGFVYTIARNLYAGLGLPLLLLSGAALVYALVRRTRGDGLLAAFALPYYVLVSLAAVRYARYVIPLLPVLAVWAGRLIDECSRIPHPDARWVGKTAGGIVLFCTLANCLWLIQPMTVLIIVTGRFNGLTNSRRFPAPWGLPRSPGLGQCPSVPIFAPRDPEPGASKRRRTRSGALSTTAKIGMLLFCRGRSQTWWCSASMTTMTRSASKTPLLSPILVS